MEMRTENKRKYRQISESLREAICSGQFAPGQQIPTEDQLIAQFAVSRSTVIRALQELQAKGLLRRQRGSGTYVQQQASASTATIGMLVPGLEPYSVFAGVYQQIVQGAEPLGWEVMIGLASGEESDPVQATLRSVQRMIQRKVRGVIYLPHALAGAGLEVNRQVTQALREAEIPIVLLDRDVVDFPGHSGLDLVSTDNQRGGQLLAEHLIERGCRRIAFLLGPWAYASTTARVAGYRKALEHHRIPLQADWVCQGDFASVTFTQQVMERIKPDGIICSADEGAALVMRHLLQQGVRIPQEVKLAGFDDIPTAALLTVPLTTVRQPVEALAYKALSVMRDRLENPKTPACRVEIDCELVVRESTAAGEDSLPAALGVS